MPDWAAILFSTFIVLVVAEIIPQAYCTGEKKIIVAYYASPIILVMIKIFWIIVYPIAKGLDKMLGVHHHERIQHKDFATFLNDDVIYTINSEIPQKYRKTIAKFNTLTSY
jgi:CBS domain containing-hemolysin-like protein